MEITDSYVFQADSDIVNNFYENDPNYIIEYNDLNNRDYCIIYFSSNDLYYPNSDIAFTESVKNKNRFEWYKNRIDYGHKHIFIRDIKKQWYLAGINVNLDNPIKLLEFLRHETKGYKVILVGSSAGGFIATIFGQQLSAERIYSFNGQFEIRTLLEKPKASTVDPILFRKKNDPEIMPYYDTLNFITNPGSIYYFHSSKCLWDIEQYNHLRGLKINKISFKTGNHGIPFLKSNLPVVLNLSKEELKGLVGKNMHPLFFSLKMVGLAKTIEGAKTIVQFALNKLYIRYIQKWKRI